jgi:hypothetical protein
MWTTWVRYWQYSKGERQELPAWVQKISYGNTVSTRIMNTIALDIATARSDRTTEVHLQVVTGAQKNEEYLSTRSTAVPVQSDVDYSTGENDVAAVQKLECLT